MATINIQVRFPVLPNGVEEEIVAALTAGKEPSKSWIRRDKKESWGAFFQKVVGESFENANGTSRQAILADARIGNRVWLIAEPDNPRDAEAVAVHLDDGSGIISQIGYLPRESRAKAWLPEGRVRAWLANVRAKDGGARGATLYVVINWREKS